MNPALIVIGVDPGPIPGITVLEYDELRRLIEANALQVSHGLAVEVVGALLTDRARGTVSVRLAVERFVVSARSGRSSTASAGAQTRDLVGELRHLADVHRCWFVQRSAAEVKPWATDARIEAAGLSACTHQMRHSRDAARHALFAAVKDGGVPDPLSKGARK